MKCFLTGYWLWSVKALSGYIDYHVKPEEREEREYPL